MAARMQFEEDEDRLTLTANAQSFTKEYPVAIVKHWLWTMDTYMYIVDFFSSMFSEFIKDKETWKSKLYIVTTSLNFHQNKWKEQVV